MGYSLHIHATSDDYVNKSCKLVFIYIPTKLVSMQNVIEVRKDNCHHSRTFLVWMWQQCSDRYASSLLVCFVFFLVLFFWREQVYTTCLHSNTYIFQYKIKIFVMNEFMSLQFSCPRDCNTMFLSIQTRKSTNVTY
jgi:hypothetical protein